MKNLFLSMLLMACWLICMGSTESAGAVIADHSNTALLAQTASAANTKTTVAGDVQIAFEQTDDGLTAPGGFLSRNWGILTLGLLGFFEVVARLTPSEKDNTILKVLTSIINVLIPNFKKGGGVF